MRVRSRGVAPTAFAVVLSCVLAGCGFDAMPASRAGAQAAPVAAAVPILAAPDPGVPQQIAPIGATLSIDNYAEAVCYGLKRFGNRYRKATEKRRVALYASSDEGKQAMLDHIDRVDRAMERLINRIRRAGLPDTGDGGQIASGVMDTLVAAQQTNYGFRPRVAALRVSDPRFVESARALLVEADSAVALALTNLGRFDSSPEFKAAFGRSRSCQEL